MAVYKKEIYIYNGLQFSYNGLRLQLEAELGCIVDDIFNSRTKIEIFNCIIQNRHKISSLLNEQVGDDYILQSIK